MMEHREEELEKLETIYERQRWLFGMVEEDDHGIKLGLWCVNDRKTETISSIIAQHVSDGAVVHTDGWKAYDGIDWEGLNLYRERHIHNGKEERTMEHSNHIEGAWADLKGHCKRIYNSIPGVGEHYECYIWEALFRRTIDKLRDNEKKKEAYISTSLSQMFDSPIVFWFESWGI